MPAPPIPTGTEDGTDRRKGASRSLHQPKHVGSFDVLLLFSKDTVGLLHKGRGG